MTPTLIKYTKFNEYLGETIKSMENLSLKKLSILDNKIKNKQGVALVEYDTDAEDKIVAALLYRFSKLPYEQIKTEVKSMKKEEKEKIIDEALKRMGKFDRPLREL